MKNQIISKCANENLSIMTFSIQFAQSWRATEVNLPKIAFLIIFLLKVCKRKFKVCVNMQTMSN